MPAPPAHLLGPDFFDRPADTVARQLLGQWLVVRDSNGKIMRHVVHETEAYLGADDLACHGRSGPTQRNGTMFGPAGKWYVYRCYGLHWMLNIVTGPKGLPAAVLLRGVGQWSGPGRLTKGLAITGGFNGLAATRKSGLWLAGSGMAVSRALVHCTPRIGVGYAGKWAKKPLRFVVDPAAL